VLGGAAFGQTSQRREILAFLRNHQVDLSATILVEGDRRCSEGFRSHESVLECTIRQISRV